MTITSPPSILLAGATGLVGSLVMRQAKNSSLDVTAVGRTPSGHADRELLWDFGAPIELPQADCAICCLGTTLRKAGSREAFRAVDYDAVLNFANASLRAGISHFLVVTAAGARLDASVFYSRVKGEVERDLTSMGFNRLDILRPGLLRGHRLESRPIETFLQHVSPLLDPLMIGAWRGYKSITAELVAAALLALCHQSQQGVYLHDNDAMIQVSRGSGSAQSQKELK